MINLAISTATGLTSKPMNRRFRIVASRADAPEPVNGSTTMSPGRQLLDCVRNGFVRLFAPILVKTVYASVPLRGSRLFNGDRRFTKRESFLHATSLLSQYYTNSRLTDSLRWMRLMASPSTGAMPSTVSLGTLSGRQGDRVGEHQAVDGGLLEPSIACPPAGRAWRPENLLGPVLVHRFGRPADRAGRADHVVEDQGHAALDRRRR